MPRSPEFQTYRDELSDKLQEIRQSDPENPEKARAKAQGYLEAQQETEEYQGARKKHLKDIEKKRNNKEKEATMVQQEKEWRKNRKKMIKKGEIDKETLEKISKMKEIIAEMPFLELIEVPCDVKEGEFEEGVVLLKLKDSSLAYIVRNGIGKNLRVEDIVCGKDEKGKELAINLQCPCDHCMTDKFKSFLIREAEKHGIKTIIFLNDAAKDSGYIMPDTFKGKKSSINFVGSNVVYEPSVLRKNYMVSDYKTLYENKFLPSMNRLSRDDYPSQFKETYEEIKLEQDIKDGKDWDFSEEAIEDAKNILTSYLSINAGVFLGVNEKVIEKILVAVKKIKDKKVLKSTCQKISNVIDEKYSKLLERLRYKAYTDSSEIGLIGDLFKGVDIDGIDKFLKSKNK